MRYTAASFFSGIGGLDLAFVWAGFEITTHVEIDPYCREVLKKHAPEYWPKAKIFTDIKTVTASEVGYADVLFGGFPCQDISIAGKRAGITDGNRSGLWFEFLRLIREIRPEVVVLENVSAIHVPTRDELGNELPSPALIVAASLSEVGYDAIWLPLRASDIGAPHQRERWFCMAYRQDNDDKRDGRTMARTPRHTRKQDDGRKPMGKGSNRRKSMAYTTSQRREWGKRSGNRIRQSEVSTGNGSGSTGNEAVGVNLVDSDSFRQGHIQRGYNPLSKLGGASSSSRRKRELKSRLGGTFDGTTDRLDRHQGRWPARPNAEQFDFEPRRVTTRRDNRVARIKAVGNMVVPQQAFPIALAAKLFLDETLL